MPNTVHIIGAGISGLSAAIRLANAGFKVHVHEATQQAGGRCRSYFDNELGCRLDNGNHLVLSGNVAIQDYLFLTGAQDKVVDRLFKLYFEEGRDIGDRALLIETADACGMDREIVEKLFAEGADEEEVRAEIAEAQRLGVTGVPFFIFAQRFGVPGAQGADVLTAAIDRARKSLAGIEAA